MATILLGAAGAALGAGFGGTVLGLSGAVLGRAVGATLGRVIDQRLMGSGSEAVEVGRVERFRLMGASEGAAVAQVYGRARIGGQVIWATRFLETVERSGGKGAPRPRSQSFSYSVSLAVALCEGVILGIGRVWADGIEIDPSTLNLRLYEGTDTQLPDPKIEAAEGAGFAPAYRGVAYVVIEDLDLGAYGNRVPQFSFEVIRPAQPAMADDVPDLRTALKAVALMPGTGEYALATTRVHYLGDPGTGQSANVNSPSGVTDLTTSLAQLRTELPSVRSLSLIVSWFGNDLRCGNCTIRPKVEQATRDGVGMAWRAGGIARAAAQEVPRVSGKSIYGGTPADRAVIEAIAAIRAGGQEVMFYPFILMEQLQGNTLPDPYSGGTGQAKLPWRGRITTSFAPGVAGTTDRTAAAGAEVAAFFGTAQASHFGASGGNITYAGPAEWSYRRFILHYAKLCVLAGGVDAFCIGSEMRGLTQIRGTGDSFPAVVAMAQLAADVRAILGTATKISYAADWTEYFGYHTGGNVYFHLDPLWSHPAISFVGIDNYMPLSDWRDGADHADAAFGSIHNLDYLTAGVAGGEGYDWFYDSPEGAAAQRRLPITDGAYGEPWVFRYKDLAGWWSNPHFDRLDGVRSGSPSGWVPGAKPIRFTEYGCAAMDKGTNEPNRFLDPKSSESGIPKYSDGRRDDLIQMQYYRAMARHWNDPARNPASEVYVGRMVDVTRAHAWAWDARPFPAFPGNINLWDDGGNYSRGHWLTGRSANQSLAAVVSEICQKSGVAEIDVSRLDGIVRGFLPDGVGSARAALQPLMLAYGFEAVEREGVLVFRLRGNRVSETLDPARLAVSNALDGDVETTRAPEAETVGKVRLAYVEAEGDYALRQAEAIFPDDASLSVSQTDLSLVLTPAEARSVTERWLAEARVARDGARFALPRSSARLGAGDVVVLDGVQYRIDRVEQAEAGLVDAVRIEPSVYRASDAAEERVIPRAFSAPVPTYPVFMDLPLLTGSEVPHAPHLAVAAQPWPGTVGVWSAPDEDGFALNTLIAAPSVIGLTETPMFAAPIGRWDRGEPLRVRLSAGALSSASQLSVLNGANVMAIGNGSSEGWEVFQFASANLVAPLTYELSVRLRGQAGSDGDMPTVWPAGSTVVLLNGAPRQIELALTARGLARNYRIGAADRGFDDPEVVAITAAFRGIGLRPFAPGHLQAVPLAGGDVALSWVRRTRIDGDTWESAEVPMGEEREAYVVRVLVASSVRREVEVTAPFWTYTATDRAADGVSGAYQVSVAQRSERFGPGAFRTLALSA